MSPRNFDSLTSEPEAKESQPTPGRQIELASTSSWLHPDRNEDSVVGDRIRLAQESDPNHNFDIHTAPKYAEEDKERLRQAARTELGHADQMDQLQVSAVLDGLSGRKLGEGMLASRIAGAEIAQRMSQLSADSGETETMDAIRDAYRLANAEVAWVKGRDLPPGEQKEEYRDMMNMNAEREEELEQLGCTMEIMRTIETPDGKKKVVFGHAGDGAILHFDSKNGQLIERTQPQSAVEIARQKGVISPQEYDDIMSRDEKRWPKRIGNLKGLAGNIRQAPLGGIDGKSMQERLEAANIFLRLMDAGNPPHGDYSAAAEDLLQVGSFEVGDGDIVIQASDGLIDNVPLEVIQEKLRQGLSPEKIKDELTWEATERGGGAIDDNGDPIPAQPEAKGADDISLAITKFESAPDTSETELDLADIEIVDDEDEIQLDDEDLEEISLAEAEEIEQARKDIDQI